MVDPPTMLAMPADEQICAKRQKLSQLVPQYHKYLIRLRFTRDIGLDFPRGRGQRPIFTLRLQKSQRAFVPVPRAWAQESRLEDRVIMTELQANSEVSPPAGQDGPADRDARRKKLLQDTNFGQATNSARSALGRPDVNSQTSGRDATSVRGGVDADSARSHKPKFFDSSGKEVDPTKVASDQPLYSVSVTDKGAVVNFFENASAAQSNRPYAREEVSTRSDGNRIIESKSFYVFDESSRAQRCKQTEVSLDKTTGQLTLKTIDATGREDSFAFDKDGKALSMSIHRQDGSYTFTLVDGHPTKVSRDGQELSGDTANLELQK